MAQNRDSDNARAQHGDRRLEEKRQKYGDLADLTVDELQERAAQKGIKDRSQMRKDDLLRALTDKS
ncbi:Rho termination factor N-terminal domain-containing protein [Streptomyces desertarenae]|uniref:Rho termination factor N-terminal domain-containing protein n=1 Tax=Streptomyces desertarenae TaxID=2666184 RepID=A0ABW4PGQ8_9ACTN